MKGNVMQKKSLPVRGAIGTALAVGILAAGVGPAMAETANDDAAASQSTDQGEPTTQNDDAKSEQATPERSYDEDLSESSDLSQGVDVRTGSGSSKALPEDTSDEADEATDESGDADEANIADVEETEAETPVVEDEADAAEDEAPAADESSTAEDETPAVEDEAPAATDETDAPATEDETPTAEEAAPVEDETPAEDAAPVEDETPAPADEAPAEDAAPATDPAFNETITADDSNGDYEIVTAANGEKLLRVNGKLYGINDAPEHTVDTATTTQSAYEANMDKHLFDGINAERAKKDLAAYNTTIELDDLADQRINEIMVDFNHVDNLMDRTPGTANKAGENIFKGQIEALANALKGNPDYEQILNAYKQSPTHFGSIMSSQYTHVGIATKYDAQGRIYNVIVFAKYENGTLIPALAVTQVEGYGYVDVQTLGAGDAQSGIFTPTTDPGTDPTDPTDPGTPTDPTDPGTNPTDPGTNPTDPGTGTNPTNPTDPGTSPVNPGTDGGWTTPVITPGDNGTVVITNPVTGEQIVVPENGTGATVTLPNGQVVTVVDSNNDGVDDFTGYGIVVAADGTVRLDAPEVTPAVADAAAPAQAADAAQAQSAEGQSAGAEVTTGADGSTTGVAAAAGGVGILASLSVIALAILRRGKGSKVAAGRHLA